MLKDLCVPTYLYGHNLNFLYLVGFKNTKPTISHLAKPVFGSRKSIATLYFCLKVYHLVEYNDYWQNQKWLMACHHKRKEQNHYGNG